MSTIDFNSFMDSVSLSLDLAEACALKDKNKKINFDVAIPDFKATNHSFANHSKKTALGALYIASKLNLGEERLKNLYIAACLHDIGAVEAFVESHQNSSFMYEHSEFGSKIVKKLPLDSSIPDFIKFHHENWDGSGPFGLSGSNIPEESQIIHAADMFELVYNNDKPYWVQKDRLIDWIRSKEDRFFSKYIVDVFMEVLASDRFWLDFENISSYPNILSRMHPPITAPVSLSIMEDIAVVFAAIIDKKSNFTHEHSVGISHYAEMFSKYYSFDEEITQKMTIAALLHDIGKLSIPNYILDKPGRLTPEEYNIIKTHTYYTKLILGNIGGMEDIAQWAGNHHETLRGTGYPDGIDSEQLCLNSRIMTVCDIYQALTEERSYRGVMPKDKALGIIDSMVEIGNIDRNVVKVLKEII